MATTPIFQPNPVVLPEYYRKKQRYGGLTTQETLEAGTQIATAAVLAHNADAAAHGINDGNGVEKANRALRKYISGKARVASRTGACNVLVIGTSLSESGSNGTSTNSTSYTYRWQDAFRDIERRKIGQTIGGIGFLPPDWATDVVTPKPYSSQAGTFSMKRMQFGLGKRTSEAKATASKTYTQTCTGFDILYTRSPAAGVLYYSVDGGTNVEISTPVGTTASGYKTAVTGLSDAAHTITIGWVSGTIYFEGVAFYRGDETVGLRVWDGARSGSTTADFIESSWPYWWGVIGLINPDLIVLELGINEYLFNVTVAQYTANLSALVASLKSRARGCGIVLMATWAKGSEPAGTHAAYVAAAKSVAAADPMVLFFDGSIRTYSTETESTANAFGFLESDKLHATPCGSSALAIGLSDFLGKVS